MLIGAFIFALGMAVGFAIRHYWTFLNRKVQPQPYDKYRNKDGLLSRKAVRESR